MANGKRDLLGYVLSGGAAAVVLAVLLFLWRIMLPLYQRAAILSLGALLLLVVMSLLAVPLWRRRPVGKPEGQALPDWQRGRAQVACILAALGVLALFDYQEVVGPFYSRSILSADVGPLILGRSWVSYEPIDFDPKEAPDPPPEAMRRELGWIADAGYGGVITFGSLGTRSMIPRLAKANGLAVIMGVWDPRDRQEIARALGQRRYVDAYVVGHNRLELHDGYSYRVLAQAVQQLRFRARRPVSTTEPLQRYLQDDRLLTIGDWLFPDGHSGVASSQAATAREFLDKTLAEARTAFTLARKVADRKDAGSQPILLKMIAFPARGVRVASPSLQAEFFAKVLDGRQAAFGPFAADISIAIHAAYDAPWKRGSPFYDWDPYTGLLGPDGTPRPATREIVKRL